MIISKYNIKKIEKDEVHTDITEKIELFLSSKKLEGLSELTLEGYERDLNIFADHVKKKVEDITSADIRDYLASFKENKMCMIVKKLSILKRYYNLISVVELI